MLSTGLRNDEEYRPAFRCTNISLPIDSEQVDN